MKPGSMAALLNRPFANIEEHDEALIVRWNAAVGPDDTVWHCGDFCYRCPEIRARAIFVRLGGRRRFLVQGSHDRIGARLPWDGIFDVARVLVPLPDGTVQGVWCPH
jgi:calcineurin-like phosphoesterase family protein